jgi:hypothetical protein
VLFDVMAQPGNVDSGDIVLNARCFADRVIGSACYHGPICKLNDRDFICFAVVGVKLFTAMCWVVGVRGNIYTCFWIKK